MKRTSGGGVAEETPATSWQDSPKRKGKEDEIDRRQSREEREGGVQLREAEAEAPMSDKKVGNGEQTNGQEGGGQPKKKKKKKREKKGGLELSRSTTDLSGIREKADTIDRKKSKKRNTRSIARVCSEATLTGAPAKGGAADKMRVYECSLFRSSNACSPRAVTGSSQSKAPPEINSSASEEEGAPFPVGGAEDQHRASNAAMLASTTGESQWGEDVGTSTSGEGDQLLSADEPPEEGPGSRQPSTSRDEDATPDEQQLNETLMKVQRLLTVLMDEDQSMSKPAAFTGLLEIGLEYGSLSRAPSFPRSQFMACMRVYMLHSSRNVRSTALYCMHMFVRDVSLLEVLIDNSLHYLIAQSLEREQGGTMERMQAIKLVRTICTVSPALMPRCLVQALVAIASEEADMLCSSCLLALAEIAIGNTSIVALCNGIPVLISAAVSPLHTDIRQPLVMCLLYLLNESRTRRYIRPQADIRLLFTPLTDTFHLPKAGYPPEQSAVWDACIKTLCVMLKSWTGVIYLASDQQGLKTFVDALRLPHPELHELILDALNLLFRIPRSAMTLSRGFGRRGSPSESHAEQSSEEAQRANLIDNYLSALLMAFISCGLLEVLVELGKTQDSSARKLDEKALMLLGEILHLSDILMPASQCANIQALPTLIISAVSFNRKNGVWCVASEMVNSLHQYSNTRVEEDSMDALDSQPLTQSWRRSQKKDRRLDRIDGIKRKMDWDMDTRQLLAKLQNSGVLATKEYTKWAWDTISEVLEGPLRNPVHTEYTKTKTNFFERLLTFFRPSSCQFSTLPWSHDNHQKYVRVACQTLEILLKPEVPDNIGVKFLKSDPLFSEISAILQAVAEKIPDDPLGALLLTDPPCSNMTCEYFALIGTLSSTHEGLEFLRSTKIFNWLRTLSEQQGQDQLRKRVLTCLDYNMPTGPARPLLRGCLRSRSMVVRALATKHMRTLLRAGVSNFSVWAIDFLVERLSDQDRQVTHEALSVLDEASDNFECLKSFIEKKPQALKKLGKEGKNMMIRFLSIEAGFDYLEEINFIGPEVELWRASLSIQYAIDIEADLDEAFSENVYSNGGKKSVIPPPHMYGALAKTEKGCAFLRNGRYLDEVWATLTNESVSPLERRAALWAVGHVGESETGLAFLEELNAIGYIANLAVTVDNLALRGTCFYVLGLLSRTERGKQVLSTLGWETPRTRKTNTICMPKDITSRCLLQVKECVYQGSWAVLCANHLVCRYKLSDQRHGIITQICNLGSGLTYKGAAQTLKRLRMKSPEMFFSHSLVANVYRLLETYRFSLAARRFVYGLIDGSAHTPGYWQSIHRYLAGSAAATRAQADGVLTRPTGDPHHQATDAHSA